MTSRLEVQPPVGDTRAGGAAGVGTHFVKNVPVAPSIPLASVRHPVPWSALVIFLVVATAILNGCIAFIDWYTINTDIPLPHGTSIHAILKNCAVSFSPSDRNMSYVSVKAWLNHAERFPTASGTYRLDELPIEWSQDYSTVKIRLALTRSFRFLLCSVHFHLDPTFTFQNLWIHYAPAESYVDVHASLPIRASQAIRLKALHAMVDVQALMAPSVHLHIGDGSLSFKVAQDNLTTTELVSVKSRTAPVHVVSNTPVGLKMTADTARKALIRSQGARISSVSETDMTINLDTNLDTSSSPQVTMDVDVDNSAFYIDVDETGSKEGEHGEPPHLIDWSVERIEGLQPWFDYEQSSPWIVEILEHRIARSGHWQYLSSSAYLQGNNWFVLFSAGLLQPRQKRLRVHILGIFCRSRGELDLTPVIPDESVATVDDVATPVVSANNPQRLWADKATFWRELLKSSLQTTEFGGFIGGTRSLQHCQQEILADTFLVLWRALNSSRTESSMIAYQPPDGPKIRFSVRDDAVIQDFVTWSDVWFFIVAILVNVVFAGVVACAANARVHRLSAEFLLEEFNTSGILRTASHRLDYEVSKTEDEGWSVSVTRVYHPTSGFVLRWNHDTPVPHSRFGIHIRPVDMDWLHLKMTTDKQAAIAKNDSQDMFSGRTKQPFRDDPREVYLYLPLSAARAAQDVVVYQRQLFVPFKNPGKVQLDCQQHYQLNPVLKYRFQLQAVNAQGRVVDQSAWSAEVQPDAGLMFIDLPLLILRRFCPVRYSSLDMFVRKHVVKSAPNVTQLRLDTFSLEMFSDVTPIRTTKRRRLPRGSLRHGVTAPRRDRRRVDAPGAHSLARLTSIAEPEEDVQIPWHETLSFQLILSITSGNYPSPFEDRRITTQRLLLLGRPDVLLAGREGGQSVIQLRGDPRQAVTLTQSRISQTRLTVDLSDARTSRRVASGSVRLLEVFEMFQDVRTHGIQPMDIHVRLNNIDTAAQWGKLSFMLSMPGLEEFERHLPSPFPHRQSTTQKSSPRNHRLLNGAIKAGDVIPSILPYITPIHSPQQSPREDRADSTVTEPLRLSSSTASLWSDPTVRASRRARLESSAHSAVPLDIVYTYRPSVSFVRDHPGAQHLEGTDVSVSWVWELSSCTGSTSSRDFWGGAELKPDNIFLHLIDHTTGDYLGPLHLGHPIPNTGTYSWTTEATFEPDMTARSCFLTLSVQPVVAGEPLEVIACSNTFFVLRCLPLCEFEMCYAAFCRTHKLEMEHLSESRLRENGIVVFEADVKVCPDLRHPVPFEPAVPCVQCPGQCVPSSVSKMVRLHDESSASFQEICTAPPTEGPINVYKAVSRRLKIVENCRIDRDVYWWSDAPDTSLLQFDLPYHSLVYQMGQLLLFKYRYLREIFAKFVPSSTALDPSIYHQHERFRKLRYLEFKILPLIIQMFLFLVQLLWFAAVPSLILIGFVNHPHRDVDSNYIVDFVFDPSLRFILSLRFPGAVVVLLSAFWIFFITIVVLFSPIFRYSHPRIRRAVQAAGSTMQNIAGVLTPWLLMMFLLWLVLGALINSEGFLPYAVMSASVAFAVYTVSSSFSGAREIVAKFIDENLELLLSIAMRHWFESIGREGREKRDVAEVKKIGERKDRFRENIKEARTNLLQTQQLAIERTELRVGTSLDLDRDLSVKSRRFREELCTYIFQKAVASPGNIFVIVNGRPVGLDNETSWPVGTRFATVAEVEHNARKVDALLHGFEVACLQDGVKYGPRFNNSVERHADNGSQFSIGIVAVPRYPLPQKVSFEKKVGLIFSSFDKDEDDHLNEVELTMWQAILKKPEFDTWEETEDYYHQTFGVDMNGEAGATVRSLSQYYHAQQEELDHDYQRLFPIARDTPTNDVEDVAEEMSSQGSEFDVLSVDDDLETFEEDEAETEEDTAKTQQLEEQWLLEYRRDQIKLEEKLVGNVNTQLLQEIYMIVTQEQQEKRFRKADFPDTFLASNLVATQFAYLSPVFSKTAILGGSGLHELEETTHLRSRRGPGNAVTSIDDTLTEIVKFVGLETTNDLIRQFHSNYLQMFEPTVLQTGISHFYDNIITERIQSKGRQVLNTRVDLEKAPLDKVSIEFLTTGSPKTAFQALKALRRYCLARDAELREKLCDATASGPLQMQLQASLLVQALVEVDLLPAEEIEKQFAETKTPDGGLREVVLWVPLRRECAQFLGSLIETHMGMQSSRFSVEDLMEIARHLTSNYLWLGAFLMLLQLMGLSLPNDDLPGEAVFIPSERSAGFFTESTQLFASTIVSDEGTIVLENNSGTLKERANVSRVKKVFSQLSNNTGFLPVDLADEAILLLTDNCLNHAGVVACLQHLNIGGIGKAGSEDINVLMDLGFAPDAVCYNIESSSDLKEDILDWTEYRKSSWFTEELTEAFHRLTASSPGFMGKSQMIEFAREIKKLFQAGSSRASGRVPSMRRRTLQPADGDVQTILKGIVDDQAPAVPAVYMEENLITFEMYHRAATRLGLSCSRSHSRLMWALFSNETSGGVRQFLPAGEISHFTVRLYLQPVAQGGRPLSREEGIEDAVAFRGCVNFGMFRGLLRRLGLTVSDKGARNLWDDLQKDPVEISYKDATTGVSTTKYLRIEMDITGLDPMRGRTVHVTTLRKDLPRLLCGGLWPEAVEILFNLRLQLGVSKQRLKAVLEEFAWKGNRYGLLRPEDLPIVMSEATVEGLTFSMLRDLLAKMRLRLPEQDVKRMFDLMDVNHDHTLDLRELVAGFDMLFQRFVPNQIIDAVGLSYIQQLYVTAAVVSSLVALFCFIGFAISAFVGLQNGVSAAVQSIIALAGAVGLQSGASESIERVQKRMKKRISVIVGEDLDKRMKQQQEVEKTMSMERAAEKKLVVDQKPIEIRYILPHRLRPDRNDPRPCVTFHPGDEVFLQPTVAGGATNLEWAIYPRMPPRTGLHFDSRTGILSGTIPSTEHSYTPGVSDHTGEVSLVLHASPSDQRSLLERKMDTQLSAADDSKGVGSRSMQKKVLKPVCLPRKTFVVVARNTAGAARCRITFQIVSHARDTSQRAR